MKCFAVLLCLVWACQAKNMTRVLLTDAASSKGAVCLDGSPSGYFIRNGTGMNKDKWILHQMGGGWCFNDTDCYNRSKTYLGSSKPYPDSLGFGGFLSDDRDVNPDFYDWSIVFIIYCDGASFAGFMEEPIKVMDTQLYFRGFNNLKAVLDDLLEKGMKNASEVILTGCSAGGLATYVHADFVQSYIPSGIKFKAFADAGYFLDIPDVEGMRLFSEGMSGVFKLQNVSGGLNQDCIKAMSAEDKWKCLFAPYSFTYIKSAMFVLNSLYDTAQLAGILKLPCLPPNCNKNALKFFYKFEKEFMSQAKPILESNSTGLFLDSCLIHCQTLTDEPWSKYGVGGQTMRDTFADWYFDRPSGKGREVDCAEWPCNPTCPGKRLKHPVFSGLDKGGETLF